MFPVKVACSDANPRPATVAVLELLHEPPAVLVVEQNGPAESVRLPGAVYTNVHVIGWPGASASWTWRF
jgi:hypothetical protein